MKLAIAFGLIALVSVAAIRLRQSERERFQCPPTLAEMRSSLSGRTVADLRLDNGEAACFLNHVAKELKLVDDEGKF